MMMMVMMISLIMKIKVVMVVFYTSGYPQVRAPLLITLWSTSVHLLRKAGGNIFYDIHIVYNIIYYIMYYIICYIIR